MKIILRELIEADAFRIMEFLQDKEVTKYLAELPDPYTLESARSFIRFVKEWKMKGESYHFAISDREEGKIFGVIGMNLRKNKERVGEIGFWIGRENWGGGIIKEALPLFITFAFQELKLTTIFAEVFQSNIASVKVLEKSGFVKIGLSARKTCNSKTDEPIFLFRLENKGE
ncbi:MAG: GNAT family N-acetyltransferase [Desulfobulbaceae bacterium]|nr:GNAT family N-acetyltransferase [Desulfobulbaceae bacterium]